MASGRCEDNFDTWLSLNNHVKIWPHKTGACLIEVHLHVKSIGGLGGNESACLRQVLA